MNRAWIWIEVTAWVLGGFLVLAVAAAALQRRHRRAWDAFAQRHGWRLEANAGRGLSLHGRWKGESATLRCAAGEFRGNRVVWTEAQVGTCTPRRHDVPGVLLSPDELESLLDAAADPEPG